jgi:hypothetical protein
MPIVSSLPVLLLSSAVPQAAHGAAITSAELEQHVRYLAADELGGRAPLTEGMEKAAAYLAQALAAAGLEPAGENGTFFQVTGLKRFDYPSAPRLLLTHESGEVRELHYGVDFELKLRGTARSTEKLFLRYFYDYNHARLPLTGNPAEALYFSAGPLDKKRILAEKGIANLEDWGLEFELSRRGNIEEAGKPKDLPPRIFTELEPGGCELVELRGPVLPEWELRKFTHVQLLLDEVAVPYTDKNVVGRIRGVGTSAHPELAQEVVILSAHYDHIGIRKRPHGPEDADSICNGADDDASGCAALLELAEAFAQGPKPARTLVFLFTTGEESGGRGSARYLSAPAEALERTVADLNLEMLGRPDELVGGAGHLWLTGYERSNLGPTWAQQGLAIVADPRPTENFFSRSDNYAFALKGVVAQTLSSFGMHKEYHTPRDEAATLDYAHLEAVSQLAFRAAQGLADGSLKPAWNEGQRPEPFQVKGKDELKRRAAEGKKEKEGKKDKGGNGEEPEEPR